MLSTVIVTGGSGVLGSAIARALYPSAAAVCLVSRRQQPLQAAAEAIGPNAVALPCEITDEKSVERMFADAAARTDRPVGLLVNCAGTMAGGPTTEMSAQTFRDVLDVNVVGSFICAREAFKVMAASGGGRVINVGSVAARTPRPNSAAYTTSKFALDGLTRSLALDGRPLNIACTASDRTAWPRPHASCRTLHLLTVPLLDAPFARPLA